MKPSHSDTLEMPAGWLADVQAAAAEEQRDAQALVREAVDPYLSERRLFRPTEAHAKIAEALESLRQGKGLDGDAVMTELLAELDAASVR